MCAVANPTARIAALLACGAVLAAPASASAEGLNNLWAGLNGSATAPADPVMEMLYPPEDFELAYHPVPFLLTGTVMAVYRTVMGAFDVAMTPFYVFPTLSPRAHWDLIPWAEIEYSD